MKTPTTRAVGLQMIGYPGKKVPIIPDMRARNSRNHCRAPRCDAYMIAITTGQARRFVAIALILRSEGPIVAPRLFLGYDRRSMPVNLGWRERPR